jgi:hypothetical protein
MKFSDLTENISSFRAQNIKIYDYIFQYEDSK